MALSDPAQGAVAVTPNDSTRLNGVRALYIGVSGDVSLQVDNNATPIVFKSVAIGILPVSATIVRSTGTTATNIIALT